MRLLSSATCCFVVVALLAMANAEPRRRAKGSRKTQVKENLPFVDKELQEMAVGNKTRDGKVFSLFNIVQFKNSPCASNSAISGGGTGSTRRNGTCLTASDCASKSGAASGNCAAGFGVCCIFTVSNSGGTINQNCTYIRNPGFPSSYADTADVMYTINKCDNSVCSLRLDFESFTILGTGNTLETDAAMAVGGGVCLDTFDVTVSTNQRIPQICGQNTGQHMYIDIGRGSSDSATLNFGFSTTTASSNRQWEIKVTQVPCNCYNAPDGCLQYHTGLTGRLTTFNFLPTNDNHLRNQEQEAGFCCVRYTVCADANSMSLATQANAIAAMSGVDTLCTLDYISIGESSSMCSQDPGDNNVIGKYCGTFLSSSLTMVAANDVVCDCTAPFMVDIYTDDMDDLNAVAGNTAQSRGVCLEYQQVPC